MFTIKKEENLRHKIIIHGDKEKLENDEIIL